MATARALDPDDTEVVPPLASLNAAGCSAGPSASACLNSAFAPGGFPGG